MYSQATNYAKEKEMREAAKAAALETIRHKYPELFEKSISAKDPGVVCVKTKFGIDVSTDGLLEVLLRPHVNLLCNGKRFDLSPVITDVINKLDLDIGDMAGIGIRSGYDSIWVDQTYHNQQIGFLREIIYNLYKLKTRTQKAEEREAAEEHRKKMAEQMKASEELTAKIRAGRAEEVRRNREYKRILEEERKAAERSERNAKLAAHGKIPVKEVDLLGLHSTAANSNEKDLLDMSSLRKKQIEEDLSGLFGGARQTKKRKHRKSRKIRKSRKHSRK